MITNIWIGIAIFSLLIALCRIKFNKNNQNNKEKETGFLTVYFQSVLPLAVVFIFVTFS